ncbi:MAG: asparagine synthetase B, partial [Proteobacteria bacterium]
MNRLIRHRGPDDEGFAFFKASRQVEIYAGEDTPDDVLSSAIDYAPKIQLDKSAPAEFKLAFTHRRLSILDLSANGHQPMPSADKRYWLVFNGEIYNHIELRMELQELGHKFRTHSDTEVILAAYAEWGKRSFERLRGMFAFLIYDLHEESLIAVRDRFGIKPLYYRISESGIAFASEIKQFTALP